MDAEENSIKDLDAKGLVSFAWVYYARAFQNPQRLGCLPAGEIIRVVMGSRPK
jgi:hypothetical protein